MQHIQLKTKTSIRFTPKVPGKPATPGVAPLVDIVFLLICFYMFVTQSIQSLDERKVELPTVTQPLAQVLLPAEMVINLMPEGDIVVAHQKISINELVVKLNDVSTQAREQGQEIRVVIRADKNQTFSKLNTLMEITRRAGLSNVILRAQEVKP